MMEGFGWPNDPRGFVVRGCSPLVEEGLESCGRGADRVKEHTDSKLQVPTMLSGAVCPW